MNYDQAFQYLMADEGGYSNVQGDHGGPTSWGITQADLARWRRSPVNAADVKALSQEEAKAIYKAYYWDPLCLDDVKLYGPSCCIFDLGVLCGIHTAAIWAQSELNAQGKVLRVDGSMGPETLAALNSADPGLFIGGMRKYAVTKFKAIVARDPSQTKFFQGWMNRADRLLTLI